MISPFEQKPKEEKPVKETEALISPQAIDEAELLALAKSLDLKDFHEYKDQLTRVREWVQSKGAKSITDMITELQSIKGRIGNMNIYNLSVLAGLELEKLKIDTQIAKMEGK